MWAELLGVEKVGMNDDFFALGGHSIIAMKLTSKIMSELGTQIPVSTVFAAPTIAELATRLSEAPPPDTPLDPTSGPPPGAIQRSARRGKKRT